MKLPAVLKLIHLLKDELISIPMYEKKTANAVEESLEEKKAFSIADSYFFSLPFEHLGRISADELDKIIAKEAVGRK